MDAAVLDVVSRSALFATVPAEPVADAAARGSIRRLDRRQALFHQGDQATELAIVVAGRLKLVQVGVDGQEMIVRYVGPGEMCALVALFPGQTYPATAEAVSETRVICWPRPALEGLMLEHPRIALNAMRIQSDRMLELTDRLREIATEKVARRVARALLRLARRTGRRTDRGVELDLPLSREDLARLTGTTVFTVSRLMAEWEAAGLVEGGRERVVIRYPHGLVAIAEDLEEPGQTPPRR
jgi:CRP/FNR family transcriptional regulator, nitrogen oxide reductase regulator